jgi:hypothetical protein
MEARIELIATRLEHVQAPPYLSRLLQHEDSLPRGREDARSREPPHPASDYHVEFCRHLLNAKPQRVRPSTLQWSFDFVLYTYTGSYTRPTWRRALTLLGMKRCLWIREPGVGNGDELAGWRLLWSGKPAHAEHAAVHRGWSSAVAVEKEGAGVEPQVGM